MILRYPIELSVYWLTPAAMEFERIGIECNDDCVLRSMTFYTIDHIGEYTELINGKPAARIFSGGQDYLTNLDYRSLQGIIRRALV